MSDLIKQVFVDSRYFGSMNKEDLEKTKAEFRANAQRVLSETGADHVVYCHIEYDDDGHIQCASFYNNLCMDDKTFHERTAGLSGYTGAVHRLEPSD